MLIDWISRLNPMVSSGQWCWRDGKLEPVRKVDSTEAPWDHAPVGVPGMMESGLDCGILHIYHNHVFGGRGVHSFCMDCYKVVVMPKTLEQTKKLSDWQNSLGLASKAGAETRRYVTRKWGGYFYCRGIEDGRERYKLVREWVDENLGKDVDVILKRGCTEFEQSIGDSDKWKPVENQEQIEKEAQEVIRYTPADPVQSKALKHHVRLFWQEWDRLNKPPVTYHEKENVEE